MSRPRLPVRRGRFRADKFSRLKIFARRFSDEFFLPRIFVRRFRRALFFAADFFARDFRRIVRVAGFGGTILSQ
jgi:hypothetical protein